MKSHIFIALAGLTIASSAMASETVTYEYDAQGRLVKVVRQGSSNSTTTYNHDKASNRTNVTVQAQVKVVVVPLNGFTVIPLNAN